jgi:hypothetical protein
MTTKTGDDKEEDITKKKQQQKQRQPKDSNNKAASNSYSVFNAVDAAVSKPVMGSDGAAQWQEFRSRKHVVTTAGRKSSSTAPTAPLKRADRAMGFSSWQDERAVEATTRQETGDRAMHGGYQHFHKRKNKEDNKKEETDYSVPERHNGELPRPAVATATAMTMDNGGGNGNANNDTAISSSSEKKTKKKRKTKEESASAAPVVIRDPTHPLEQVAAAIQRQKMMQQQHTTTPDGGGGWETAIDPTSQRPYYFHRPTGQRTWDRPTSSMVVAATTTTTSTTTTATKTDDNDGATTTWKATKDASTGKTYYYNTKTNVTTWERPPDFLPLPLS